MENPSITPIKYKNIRFRILAALAAAYYLVKHGERINILEALLLPSFYISMAASFVIAILLITEVHYTTIKLDKYAGWYEFPIKRALLQTALGIVLPSIIAYLLATIYFMFYGINILETDYDILDYPDIIIMILGLNVYYYLYRMLYQKKIRGDNQAAMQDASDETVVSGSKGYILVHAPSEEIYLNAREEVCYFYCVNESYFIKAFNNNTYDIDTNLKEIEEQFSGRYFFRLNRNLIINFYAIRGFTPEKKGRPMVVHLKSEFFKGEPEETTKRFSVPRDKVQSFKKWLDR